jgi:hypothetical protein
LRLEALETRTMPAGLAGTAPLPVLPNFPNLPSFGKIVSDVAAVAADTVTIGADTIVSANLAILATGSVPPPQLLVAGVVAEGVSGALKLPSLVRGIDSLVTHVEKGDWIHADLDLNGLVTKVAPALTTDVDTFAHDWADLMQDFQAIFGGPQPAPSHPPQPTPQRNPQPTPQPSQQGIGGGGAIDPDNDGDSDFGGLIDPDHDPIFTR